MNESHQSYQCNQSNEIELNLVGKWMNLSVKPTSAAMMAMMALKGFAGNACHSMFNLGNLSNSGQIQSNLLLIKLNSSKGLAIGINF